MKSLENKVIIYDDSCPMCRLYTYWFVAWRFLQPENRIGFASAPLEITSQLDLDRGRHEIPLYDRESKETIYGLKALTFILGSRWTWLNRLFESRIFFLMFYPLYQIVTYNRRVIAGCKACSGFDCAPDLNRFYRALYIGLVSGFVLVIGCLLSRSPTTFSSMATGLLTAFAVVGLVTTGCMRLTQGSTAAWDYAGNYATCLLILTATLSPLLIWPLMVESFAWTNLGAAILLGLEELRRREL